MNTVRGKKVYVGLSGGVDSSVTAALLKRAGAEVHGVFIKGWYPPGIPCTWREDRNDAMRVAAHLGIPFTTLDASAEYKKAVIDYLISEYQEGRTPNPDIMCNRYVKFGAFFDHARAQGADLVATGHYARVENGLLARGLDPEKDQSYFLWDIRQEVLPRIMFPLGSYTKSAVRELARSFNLPTAGKRDSQGICFLGSISIDEFLAQEFSLSEGNVVTENGDILGVHTGAAAYTLGERIPIPGSSHSWYVVRKDMHANTLVASAEPRTPSKPDMVQLSSCNIFAPPDAGELTAQYRYHGPCITGIFDSTSSVFIPSTPINEPLSPGQSLVLYRGDIVVAGGIIE